MSTHSSSMGGSRLKGSPHPRFPFVAALISTSASTVTNLHTHLSCLNRSSLSRRKILDYSISSPSLLIDRPSHCMIILSGYCSVTDLAYSFWRRPLERSLLW
ncbi:hypothetical protein KC19_11G112700 [Ceratodon purpureus]|uniref:Uncharacterized protein n=1 Tax=Ceratodon purpureus TaxID=3225 RepID=A0A8T0GGD3_CERPU|nr:hypothetical protein KC19_11G112700 [Ceratodon purpureus]